MYSNAIHVNIAQLIGQNTQGIHLICELHLTHATTYMTLETYATMPGAPGVNTNYTIALSCQHVHAQLMFTLKANNILIKI